MFRIKRGFTSFDKAITFLLDSVSPVKQEEIEPKIAKKKGLIHNKEPEKPVKKEVKVPKIGKEKPRIVKAIEERRKEESRLKSPDT